MATYKTPGVYVEEISTIPPSIAEVETAIPVFIGFTEKGISLTAKRITSLKEYEDYFGGAEPEKNISVIIDHVTLNGREIENVVDVTIPTTSKNVMYYALQLYYANGGGPCYILPTGRIAPNMTADIKTYTDGIDASSREDEPTLIVLPDAPCWLPADQYYAVANYAVKECTRLGDRFAIIDVVKSPADTSIAAIQAFRDGVTASEDRQLKYAAAYFPYIKTQLSYVYKDEKGNIADNTFTISVSRDAAAAEAQVKLGRARTEATNARTNATTLRGRADRIKEDDTRKATAVSTAEEAEREATRLEKIVTDLEADVGRTGGPPATRRYADLTDLSKNQIKKKIDELGMVLPPSAAIAGVYASVDNARGVWKSPANVSLNYVTATTASITDNDQEDMNIDVNGGKSVNAIRPFIGKGVMVWGARTLNGNSNEWRYISVRRFFNMVEESVKKSTYWAVFEPNDQNTWTQVRSMIENYLILKWRDGALAGAKPDDSYFVRVGLGQTMTPIDVLEGRMIIEIGLAAVRPAEFIILKFSHKMQTS